MRTDRPAPARVLSLRARLTLWYTIVLVAVLCLSGGAVAWMEGRVGIRRVDRELADVEATAAKIVANELAEDATPASAAAEACETVGDRSVAVAVLDSRGVPLAAASKPLPVDELVAAARSGVPSTVRSGARAYRVRAWPESLRGFTGSIVVARSLADIDREQRELQQAMLVGIPIVLLLAAAGGWWLASVGLAPITRMARRAVNLPLTGTEDLGQPARGDEIGQLTRAFNALVARLRAALESQRQFMADASHELRTPVSIVRSAADVALSRRGRREEDYRETLEIARDQSHRLGRLVEDMLVLARADAGGYPIHRVDLDLAETVDDCRRAVKSLAAERGVDIHVAGDPEVPVRGDEELLRRLVLNLVRNAIQHTPPGGSVVIAIETAEDAVKLRVSDSGAGIPDADRARIFDRFVRLDEARGAGGAGLGLPIARWIAEAHGGSLVLESSAPGGSTFCATLPASPQRLPRDRPEASALERAIT
jgi:two-component system, OmpR family, sensor kinase